MPNNEKTVADMMKELLPDPANKIRLDDFVNDHLKKFLAESDLEHFPVQGTDISKESFMERIRRYEEITNDLQTIVILLARWSEPEQIRLLEKIFNRLAETDKGSSGLTSWISLGWYPLHLLMYSGGIAALSAKKYKALKAITGNPTRFPTYGEKDFPLVVAVAGSMSKSHDLFKSIPGNESKYTPRSDYLFALLKNRLDDLLFLRASYDALFDEFEIYSSLLYMDATDQAWSPLGRFGWKYRMGNNTNPLDRIIEEAKKEGAGWEPLQAKLFQGSPERFDTVGQVLVKNLKESSWW